MLSMCLLLVLLYFGCYVVLCVKKKFNKKLVDKRKCLNIVAINALRMHTTVAAGLFSAAQNCGRTNDGTV